MRDDKSAGAALGFAVQPGGITVRHARIHASAVREHVYHVYILASRSRRIYVGVTRDLRRRVWQHKRGCVPGFTKRYGITALVYAEAFTDVRAAIAREKQLERWPRWRKDRLISSLNPTWADLSASGK